MDVAVTQRGGHLHIRLIQSPISLLGKSSGYLFWSVGYSFIHSFIARTFIEHPQWPGTTGIESSLQKSVHLVKHKGSISIRRVKIKKCVEVVFLCYFFIFNWKIIALQCCIGFGFCPTTMRISHKHIYIYVCVCVCVCVSSPSSGLFFACHSNMYEIFCVINEYISIENNAHVYTQ